LNFKIIFYYFVIYLKCIKNKKNILFTKLIKYKYKFLNIH